jgi:hypothetical protein
MSGSLASRGAERCPTERVRAAASLRQRDREHIVDPWLPLNLDQTEGSNMYLIDGLIVVVMTFFFALPMTDARTARMKLSVVSCLGVLLAVSVVAPRLMP